MLHLGEIQSNINTHVLTNYKPNNMSLLPLGFLSSKVVSHHQVFPVHSIVEELYRKRMTQKLHRRRTNITYKGL